MTRWKIKSNQKKITEKTLRQELSDPERLQALMDHLGELLISVSDLKKYLFPSENLLEALDEVAESSSEKLHAMTDPLDQRMEILTRVLPNFITKKFVKKFEKALVNYLKNTRKTPLQFKAASVGLYFLEIHNRTKSDASTNPLWNLLFDVSYHEAMASAGGTISSAAKTSVKQNVTSNQENTISDKLFAFQDQDLSEENIELSRQALELIDSGKVELGFALDSVLLGLRKATTGIKRPPEEIVLELHQTFEQEIGINQKNNLVWGLEYAVEHLKEEEQREQFEIVLKAVQMLPPKENPVIFALYYKSVTEFYRYLKPGEQEYAEAIVKNTDSITPVLAFAQFLLRSNISNRALNAYIAASLLDPSSEMARFGAGVVCWQTESYREARLHFYRAGKLWNGYLPENHPSIQLTNELAELENFDELPQTAYDLVFSDLQPRE